MMEQEPNPFQAPLADSEIESGSMLSHFQPEGLPHPIVLGWMGLFVALGVIGSLFAGYFSLVPALLIVPLRLTWVIYARVQMNRHESTWSPGTRTFVLAIWIINILILCLDAMIIFLFSTCLLTAF